MPQDLALLEIIKLLSPLIAIQLGLAVFCVVQIIRKEVRNLSKPVWLVIVFLVNLLGPIAYLLFGRQKEN